MVPIYRQAMWLSFAQGLVLTRKDTRGHKDDVLNRPIERDYRLSRPTKIKKIGKKLILKDEGK